MNRRPEFEPDDAQLYLDLYRDADPEDAFDHFEEQRETNIEFIRGLPESDGSLEKRLGRFHAGGQILVWVVFCATAAGAIPATLALVKC